jgi:hypothetical protein
MKQTAAGLAGAGGVFGAAAAATRPPVSTALACVGAACGVAAAGIRYHAEGMEIREEQRKIDRLKGKARARSPSPRGGVARGRSKTRRVRSPSPKLSVHSPV